MRWFSVGRTPLERRKGRGRSERDGRGGKRRRLLCLIPRQPSLSRKKRGGGKQRKKILRLPLLFFVGPYFLLGATSRRVKRDSPHFKRIRKEGRRRGGKERERFFGRLSLSPSPVLKVLGAFTLTFSRIRRKLRKKVLLPDPRLLLTKGRNHRFWEIRAKASQNIPRFAFFGGMVNFAIVGIFSLPPPPPFDIRADGESAVGGREIK